MEKGKGERNSGRGSWLALTISALSVLALAIRFDMPVDHWVATHRDAGWQRLAGFCSRASEWHWLMAAAAAGVFIAWRCRRVDWMRVLCLMMISASLAGLTTDVLRAASGRTRPYAKVTQGFYGVRNGSEWLITKHAYNSFPSGHVTVAAAFVFPLFFWRRKIGGALFVLVPVVAAARIYLRAHHLSDAVAAVIVGGVVALIVWRRAATRPLGQVFRRS
jgi:membrane-associated phospholipid phosphatase